MSSGHLTPKVWSNFYHSSQLEYHFHRITSWISYLPRNWRNISSSTPYRNLPVQPEIQAPAEHPHVLNRCPHLVNQDPLAQLEVKNAISKLKNSREMGVNGLTAETLKYSSSDKLLKHLHGLIFEVWEGGKLPESWRISRLTSFWKRTGSPFDPAKHQAFSIVTLLNKLIMIILLDRMREVYEWYNEIFYHIRYFFTCV